MKEFKRAFIDFPVKHIPIRTWERLCRKAKAEGISRREKILRLIEADLRTKE